MDIRTLPRADRSGGRLVLARKHDVVTVLGALNGRINELREVELGCAELVLEPCELREQCRAVGAIRVKVTVPNATEARCLVGRE
jgi:hypothetical protein